MGKNGGARPGPGRKPGKERTLRKATAERALSGSGGWTMHLELSVSLH